MIATIKHSQDGPALLVHGVRVAEKPVGDTTLQALADQINAKAGWQPIAEAPKDGYSIDLWCVHPSLIPCRATEMRWHEGEWVDDLGWSLKGGWEATHWMSRPEPPE